MSAGVRLDLHVHSRWSPDSGLDLPTIAAAVRAAGLDGFALTDHNSVAGHGPLRTLAAEFPELIVIPGVEVSTREGHLLGYGVAEAPPRGAPIAETIDWIRAHGGVAVVPHPYRWTHGAGPRLPDRVGAAAIEATNGQSSARANRRAAELAARRRLGTTGGSDGHLAEHIGRAFTRFPEAVRSTDAAVRALGAGATRSDGRGLGWAGQLRWIGRTSIARIGRGLRPV